MGGWLSFQKDHESTEDVKKYCQSIIFVRFYGQTNSMKSHEMDRDDVDAGGREKSSLGIILNELDREIKMAPTVAEFEMTEPMKALLKKLAVIRVCTKECENEEDCLKRLLEDSKHFEKIYRERGHKSENLHDDHDFYWGTRQQMLFGKVIVDWLPEHIETKTPPMDPIFGVLLNPTGGLVGPGDLKWMHDSLFDDLGPFAYHSAVHDAFGYLKTNHNSGPGYCYLNKGIFGDWSPFGGQLFGLRYWNGLLGEAQPEEAKADQFVFK
ncbi:uncharacterized protein [Clytia hemisphaerica]|uniref:Uncharacterized protein n=1 Tax=Clytia hemisphaerica TaxID=252671 RepID=A0A7M5WWH1_9CNID